MKKILGILLILTLVETLAFAQGQGEADVMELRAAHSMPTSYHYHDGMLKFAEEVDRLSEGKMKIDIFPAAQLGEEISTMEQLKQGAIDIVLTGVSDSFVPETGVFILPFLFENGAHADKVLNGPIGQEVYSGFSKHNIKVISVWENGFRQITNNIRPINKVEDIEGLKIRTPQSPVWMSTMKALGGTPTPMPFAEVATAVVQGLVDGQENAILHIRANKTYEIQKHLAVVNYMYGPAPLLVNEDWFEGLSADDQNILLEAAEVANKHMRAVAADREQEALEFFKDEGLTITYPDLSGFRERVQPLYEGEWAEKFGTDLLNRIAEAK
jgi:tripartite ATP-independent transporter DctP family solute receptor